MEYVYPITDRVKLDKMADYLYNKNIRDYIIFEIGINLGIRVTDFTKQRVSFYREACEKGYVEMTPSKTSRYKKKVTVPINPDLKELIEEYIEGRDDDEWMFPSRKKGYALTRQQIYLILNEAAEAAGIKDNIGCHSMRKTFGYWHYYYNRDINMLMEIFNHADERVTMKYIGMTHEEQVNSMKQMNLGVRKLNKQDNKEDLI
jgi:integrase